MPPADRLAAHPRTDRSNTVRSSTARFSTDRFSTDRFSTDRFSREPAMTTVRTTPARVRTDAAAPPVVSPAVVDTAPGSGTPEARAGIGRVRALGAGLALGAATYGVAWLLDPDPRTGSFAIDLTGLIFQLGVFCLLAAMWMTHATGTSRLARGMLVVEAAVLGVATVQSAFTLPAYGGEWGPVATALDPFWPLSMFGMAIIGVKVAVAGRWRGALRVWPVVAESWFFVAMAALIAFGDVIGSYVAGAHFLVGYAALGVLLAVRPDLTRR